MKRPTGVTILALLLLANAVALAVPAAVIYSHPDIGAHFANAYLHNLLSIDKADAAPILFFWIVGAIFSLVVSVGLWLLQEPARWAMLFATGLPLGQRVIGIALALAMKSDALRHVADAFWFQTIAFALIFWYLVQPHVVCAFTGRGEFYDAYAPVEHDERGKEQS